MPRWGSKSLQDRMEYDGAVNRFEELRIEQDQDRKAPEELLP
jgi:hypothetical protein